MGGLRAVSEIPLLSLFLYLFGKAVSRPLVFSFCVKSWHLVSRRAAPKTVSGGEFDWGGTSVKW